MKILLLNTNPVVNKLVTLSAQKTSDELDVVKSIDEIKSSRYDLLVVDDTSYTESMFEELKEKITFSESLYISARETKDVPEFTSTLKKPFLPTDLVELFSLVSKKVGSKHIEKEVDIGTDFELLDSLDDDFSLEDDDLTLEDDEFSLEDDDFGEDDDIGEGVLDNEEAQKVKDLLDETSEEISNLDELDDELNFDIDDLELDSDFFEDETDSEVVKNDNELNLNEEDLEFEDDDLDLSLDVAKEDDMDETLGTEFDEELSVDEEDLLDSFDLDLETQIETAVSELSAEDLNGEVNKETLLDIATSEINSIDSLTSKDFKIAFGEEVEEIDDDALAEDETFDEVEELKQEIDEHTKNDGVEALKKLLEALNDKNVAASMKGMKISINITLGE